MFSTNENIVTMIGWVVSAALGLVGGWLLTRWNRERREVSWTLLRETDLLTTSAVQQGGVSIKVNVNGVEEDRVSVILVTIKCSGTKEIIAPKIHFIANNDAVVHVFRPAEALGLFSEKVQHKVHGNTASVEADFLNPEQQLFFELLVAKYQMGTLRVEMAEPGVKCIKMRKTSWKLDFVSAGMYSIPMPVPYDEANERMVKYQEHERENQMKYLIDEIRLLRRALESVVATNSASAGQEGSKPKEGPKG